MWDAPVADRIEVEFDYYTPRADGLLFVGHSEGLYHCTDLFRGLGRTVYEPIPAIPATPGARPG